MKSSSTNFPQEVAINKVDCLSIIYDKYASAVYGSILRNVQNISEANDILEKVFLNYWTDMQPNNFGDKILLHLLSITNQLCHKTNSLLTKDQRTTLSI